MWALAVSREGWGECEMWDDISPGRGTAACRKLPALGNGTDVSPFLGSAFWKDTSVGQETRRVDSYWWGQKRGGGESSPVINRPRGQFSLQEDLGPTPGKAQLLCKAFETSQSIQHLAQALSPCLDESVILRFDSVPRAACLWRPLAPFQRVNCLKKLLLLWWSSLNCLPSLSPFPHTLWGRKAVGLVGFLGIDLEN